MDLGHVIMNSKIFIPRRRPEHEDDFGDEATIGLQLKRKGKSFEELGDYDFGFFLGKVDGMFHIGTHEVGVFKPTRLESYKTMEALHKSWRLD